MSEVVLGVHPTGRPARVGSTSKSKKQTLVRDSSPRARRANTAALSEFSVSVGRRHAGHEAAPEYLPHHQELLRVQAQAKAHKLLEEFVMAHGFQVLGSLPLLHGGPFP